MVATSAEIRQQFIDFFVERGHTRVASAPVVPADDPTLIFTNAGMNQFKDVFLGTGGRPYSRAVNTQKCIRVSGKHNDLEEVGRDTYHHTFFEMLGNWSFGDYYKREAIQWAWELLTEVWKLPKDRLWATVFGGDETLGLEADTEAEQLWREVTDIAPERIIHGSAKDNFWEMGQTGPCGPCSEIHYDFGPDDADRNDGADPAIGVNAGKERFIELWNLVFIQYNRDGEGVLTSLPAKHVDTGLGFERITRAIQGVASNYDTDIFTTIMTAIREVTGAADSDGRTMTALRVIADHVRTLAFAIADGAIPSNDGRGYVLRRLLRRAARFGRQVLGRDDPFIHRLVPTLVGQMGDVFGELREKPDHIAAVIEREEALFSRTLGAGLVKFEAIASAAAAEQRSQINAEEAWDLYQTDGFPIDLTNQMAEERSLTVDTAGFEELLEEQRRKSRNVKKDHGAITVAIHDLPATDDQPKYEDITEVDARAKLLGWIDGSTFISEGRIETGAAHSLILDATSFYGEAGGQAGDVGEIRSETGVFTVTGAAKHGEAVFHVGEVTDGHFEAGQEVELRVDPRRLDIMRNHTATHLLHWALRRRIGDTIEQRGSFVGPDRFTFDFNHNGPVPADALADVERMVNAEIVANHPVYWEVLPIDDAKTLGAMALFGEKYGDDVRVVAVGARSRDDLPDALSREFCGGTHVSATGRIGLFKIVREMAVSSGIRRIEGVTGMTAFAAVQSMESVLKDLAEKIGAPVDDLPARIESMQTEIKTLRKAARAGAAADLKSQVDGWVAEAEEVGGVKLIFVQVDPVPVEQARGALDQIRQKAGECVAMLGFGGEGKATLLCAVSDGAIAKGVKAGDMVRIAAKKVGGGGGGRPQMAQAGGKQPEKLPEALAAAKAAAMETLGACTSDG